MMNFQGAAGTTIIRIGMRFLAIGAAALLFFGIDSGSLISSDDAIYARAAIESARDGRLFDVTWMGHPLFEKGPVLFSAIQLSALTDGPIEMQARLPGVLFAFLVLLLIYRIALDLGMSRVGALFAAGFCLAVNLFYFNARRPMTDIPGLMFALAGFRTMLVARTSGQGFIGGVMFGLSALCKLTSPVPFVLAAVIARLLPTRPRPPCTDGCAPVDATEAPFGMWRLALLAAAGGLIAFLPWHAIMTVMHGKNFLETYFGYHLFFRLGESVVGAGATETYIGWLMHRDMPAVFILIPAVCVSVIGVVRRDRAATVAWLLLLCPLIPLALSSTALPHYLVAVVPGAALLAGHAGDRLFSLVGSRPIPAIAVVAGLSVGLGAAFASSSLEDLQNPDYSHDSRALCEIMRDDRSVARIGGMFDLHDMAIPLYCDTDMKLFGSNPGFIRAVSGIPMLKPVFSTFADGDLDDFADTGEILVCEKHGVDTLKEMAERTGLKLNIREFGTRFAVTATKP